jgi:hypothetical protein
MDVITKEPHNAKSPCTVQYSNFLFHRNRRTFGCWIDHSGPVLYAVCVCIGSSKSVEWMEYGLIQSNPIRCDAIQSHNFAAFFVSFHFVSVQVKFVSFSSVEWIPVRHCSPIRPALPFRFSALSVVASWDCTFGNFLPSPCRISPPHC